jgi:hypothetical protein
MGLELFSPDEERSAVVTAIRAPDGVDSTAVVKGLRDRFGMTIANGQGNLKGKIFRIGHIGWSTSSTSPPRWRRSSCSHGRRADRARCASPRKPGPSTPV